MAASGLWSDEPASAQDEDLSVLRRPIALGDPITYWQLGSVFEARYDVPDVPMQGEMDPFFFLTKHKNFIPHEYPCRTQFAEDHRGKRPEPAASFEPNRWWLPFGSPRVDLSGFWFRPTKIAAWAGTELRCGTAGEARLRLGTCGGAILWVNGTEIGWMAPYGRNLEEKREFSVPLRAGRNEIVLFFDDLAERDARFFFQLDYVAGPNAEIGLPVPVSGALAGALEGALETMRFERTHYLGQPIRILFAQPLPEDIKAEIVIEGDFISTDRSDRVFELPAGSTSLEFGPSSSVPADFRHFRISLIADDFVATRTLGVEICHADPQGGAPSTLEARIGEALDEVAHRAEPDTVRAFARLAVGLAGPETDAMIAKSLGAIEDCYDCADFLLVPLLWSRIRWGEVLGEAVRARIDRAILSYRYWMDEPGNDVQWYFSENHALLFHTAAYLAGHLFPEKRFLRSGRFGKEQSGIGRERVRSWLDHFEHWEMAEFNSAPYFPIDLKGLSALMALAPDRDIADRARAAILRLLEIVARSSHHGMITAAEGRSYEHTLRAGRSLELSALTRLLWGVGGFGSRFHCLPQMAVLLRDHGLEIPSSLGAVASFQGPGALEWRFAQGQNRFAALYHYKTADVAMGSAAHYRWNEWGYQETLLHLRLGQKPEAAIWINHPGETIQFGAGRPSYWGGSGTIPRVHQYRGLAVLDFTAHAEQPPFTHAWFPADMFDESRVTGSIALARSGSGTVLLKASGPIEQVTEGPTAGAELRLLGQSGRWIVRLGDKSGLTDLKALSSRFEGLKISEKDDGSWTIDDPDYGPVRFLSDGVIEAEGRRLVPSDWTIRGESEQLGMDQPARSA
jgi:hypothetical protein